MSGDWETRTDSRSVITLWFWGCASAACCHWANCDLVWVVWTNGSCCGCFDGQSCGGFFFSPGTQVAPEELAEGISFRSSLWSEVPACHRIPAVCRVMHRRTSPQDSIFRHHGLPHLPEIFGSLRIWGLWGFFVCLFLVNLRADCCAALWFLLLPSLLPEKTFSEETLPWCPACCCLALRALALLLLPVLDLFSFFP